MKSCVTKSACDGVNAHQISNVLDSLYVSRFFTETFIFLAILSYALGQ